MPHFFLQLARNRHPSPPVIFLQFACLFTAIRVGMPPGLASIVQQSQAFFTLLIALLWLRERFSSWQLAGLLLGFVLTLLGALGLFPIAPFFAVAALFESNQIIWAEALTFKSLFSVAYLALVSTLSGYRRQCTCIPWKVGCPRHVFSRGRAVRPL